ncbi:MAG: class II aldolase/adducin family protein [Cyanobacteria bacterium REEB65]|nr:class II aldolase/adducin family protein [Cyanobacteria bacterium REEB65]
MTEFELRKQLVAICRRLYERELIVGTAGNVSAKVTVDRVLTTPTGICKAHLEPGDLVVVDGTGRKIGGSREPSSEYDMHRAIYVARPDVAAVVHAHPMAATAFTVAGRSLAEPLLTEAAQCIGRIATAAYSTPGTPGVGHGVSEWIRDHDVVLLDHHGAVACGPDLEVAFGYMETLEHTARIVLYASMLGAAQPLPPGEADRLLATRQRPPVAPGHRRW